MQWCGNGEFFSRFNDVSGENINFSILAPFAIYLHGSLGIIGKAANTLQSFINNIFWQFDFAGIGN